MQITHFFGITDEGTKEFGNKIRIMYRGDGSRIYKINIKIIQNRIIVKIKCGI